MPTAAHLSAEPGAADQPPRRAARAIVSAGALRHNLRRVRERAPGARVMAVIKANGYGHGLVGTARALREADAFAVARMEEAVALRQAGLDQPVVLLEGVLDPQQLPLASALGLELVVHSAEQLAMLEAASLARPVQAWLKIDTGMNRLGFPQDAARDAAARLERCGNVRPGIRLMTHLACADERDDGVTGGQLERFRAALGDLPGERSIANSAALLWRPETHADWVRPGIMLYGASPFADTTGPELGLQPAMELLSTVIALRTVQRGERVGYGGVWTAREDTRLAIAAIGYGDGYSRHLGSGTPVLVRGQRAPLAGRISMDMIAIDVTRVPGVEVGDEVTLWGRGLAVEELARLAGTIPYELLCGVTQRVGVTMS
ncbi:MAG: alanine racemase [Gammaproteobacteria bacterium]|jgi:alanine racemase